MSDTIVLPPGYKTDARNVILVVAVLGEVLQGGLFFGWNALSIMIKDLGNYNEGCYETETAGTALAPSSSSYTDAYSSSQEICKSQESKLALLWTVGIFALNCGPVLMGFVLDYLGPKFTAILGVVLNMLGLILFGVSSTNGTNAFVAAAIILGLGNITFHLAQFHISALYPRKRGLISSVFVAGFTGSGIIMYILLLIFQDAGYTVGAYRGVLIGYAGICALFIPLIAWMMPNDSFRIGSMYLLRDDWKFEIRQRSEMDRLYRRATTLQDFVAAASAAGGTNIAVAGTAVSMYGHDSGYTGTGTAAGGTGIASSTMSHSHSLNDNNNNNNNSTALAQHHEQSNVAMGHDGYGTTSASMEYSSTTGLVGGTMPDSSDPVWNSAPTATGTGGDASEDERRRRQMQQQQQWGGGMYGESNQSQGQNRGVPLPSPYYYHGGNNNSQATNNNTNNTNDNNAATNANGHHQSIINENGVDGTVINPESMPLPPDVVWGPLVFEARRFVELRKKTFKEQFLSTESFGMGVFYTLNVFFLQFYLGTQRLQLDYKGDYNNAYSNFGNVIVAFAFLTIPIIGWLLDKKGYGITMGSINALAVLASILQALPVLWIQSITLVVWMVARFFMYSSYFAIFGGLFGFRNFGKLVAIDNTFNGLFGLLQYPLTYLAIHSFNGNFTAINVAQVILLLPLFIFCYYMGKWEREDLVPIRPLEGEELPCDMMSARTRKALPTVHLPHIELPVLGGRHGGNTRGGNHSMDEMP